MMTNVLNTMKYVYYRADRDAVVVRVPAQKTKTFTLRYGKKEAIASAISYRNQILGDKN
jgi:hypothetical protein